MSDRSNSSEIDGEWFGWFMLGLIGVCAVAALLVEWPTLVWSTLNLHPALVHPTEVAGVTLRWMFSVHHHWREPRAWAGVVPPLWIGIVLDVLLVSGLVLLASSVAMRFGMWGGRSRAGLHEHDPRRNAKPRAFAKPRDWSHLQPASGEARTGALAWSVSGAVRPLVGERRRPAGRGGDGWNLGQIRRREVRSGPEQHLMVVAPTRSGKTMRVVATEAHEHDGPLVVTSNKLDVLHHTIDARRRRGPVWVYAPMTPLPSGVACAGWSPLVVCRSWPGALRMGQWLHDADPDAGELGKGDGAARFYDRNAVERALPPVLHAAALAGLSMAEVYDWLLVGSDALDEPREILHVHGAERAAVALRALQQMDAKAQGFVLMSAAQLLAAYRHPEVQDADRDEFRPDRLLAEHGTLYLIAPESEQAALAPIFGGLLGQVLRECERDAGVVADPRRLPLLKILADEAAHLAPLGKLPTYLSVSAGLGVRWCVVYQSLAQLRARYGFDADSISANALCKLFLGPIHDKTTRDELIALLGNEYVEQTSETSGRWGAATTTTRHEQPRPKLGAEELAQLGDGEAVAIHGRDLPAIVHLPFWWEWQDGSTPDEALRRAREQEGGAAA